VSDREVSEDGVIRFAAGDRLFVEGEPADFVYVLQSGVVRITKLVFREQMLVEELTGGAICGDVAMAEGSRYPVSAVAVEPVEALAIRPADFGSTLLLDPELGRLVIRKMAARVAAAHFRVGVMSMRSAEGRVLLQLRWELERSGAPEFDGFAAVPHDLPEVLALEAEQVRQVLTRISEAGIVEFDPSGRFRVLDLAAFERRLAYLELADRFA
jgi:CRP-like cAMP-binding protein